MSSKKNSAKHSRNFPAKNAPKGRQRNEECAAASNSEPRRVNVSGADPADFNNLRAQLTAYNLEKREVVGDGNCLFRSISDQLDGNQRGHMRYRREVCEYMLSHRNDFEAFIDFDDAEGNARTFEEYIQVLQRPGTYADQLSIVAFARLYNLVVVIHQYGTNVWRVDGTSEVKPKPSNASANAVRQVHILYHPHGDHYDSLRRIGDHSDKPTSIYIVTGSSSNAQSNASRNSEQKQSSTKKESWRDEEELREQLALISYTETYDDAENGGVEQSTSNDSTADNVHENLADSHQPCAEADLEAQLLQLQIAEIENSSVPKLDDAADYNDFENPELSDSETHNELAERTWKEMNASNDTAGQTGAASSTSSTSLKPNARAIREQKRQEKKKRAELRHRERIQQMNEATQPKSGSNRNTEVSTNLPHHMDDDALLITDSNIINI